jgi:hypothetical protein
MRSRLFVELQDLLELVILPGLAIVLPWKLAFRAFGWLARQPWLYHEPCSRALQQARALGWAGENEAHWLWVRKLVTLIDHADHYLGLTRSDKWMCRHLVVQGSWPADHQPHMLLTFHWGAGYWGLRHAAASGLSPHALVASLDSNAYQGRAVLRRYARSRNANVSNTLGADNLDVSKDLKKIAKSVRLGQPLLGVVDVPADDAKAALDVTILGMKARVPRGLFKIAVERQIDVVVYITGLNTQTGQRFLRIKTIGVFDNIQTLADTLFQELDTVIALDAPAWHFWSVSERLFRSK